MVAASTDQSLQINILHYLFNNHSSFTSYLVLNTSSLTKPPTFTGGFVFTTTVVQSESGHCDIIVQIDILDGIQNLDPFFHGTLECFPA